jgi:hypothetical protein
VPPCISTALPPTVLHDTGSGRAVVVYLGVILQALGTLTTPTNDDVHPPTTERCPARTMTLDDLLVVIQNGAQHTG